MFNAIKAWASSVLGSKATCSQVSAGGNHTVAFAALRVLVGKDGDGLWFAQGIDIDYAAGGYSAEDAQSRFEAGLIATVQANLERFGSVERFLKAPPAQEWLPLIGNAEEYSVSVVSFHELPETLRSPCFPFRGLEYISKSGIAA